MTPEHKALLVAEAEQLRAIVRPAQERLTEINALLAAERAREAYALSARTRDERVKQAAAARRRRRAEEAAMPDPRLPRGDE